jgi:hypothetical protein
MSILKGNYKLKKKIESKKISEEDEIENKLKQEAMKRVGGSMVYVSKKSINWDLKPEDNKKRK